MRFLWPGFLYLLTVIPLLVGVYIWMLRRRRRFAVRYSSLALLREVLPPHARLRRHIPFGLFLLALASLVTALSRPFTVIRIPTNQTTVVLALDVSHSMCSTDISPNRLQAAENAALGFVERLKARTQIGVVAFSGFAELIQVPTADPELLHIAIDSLTIGSTTAIGSGTLKSLDTIAKIDPNVAPYSYEQVLDPSAGSGSAPVPDGAFTPDIIILLTDGVSNTGPDPLDAAQQAADRGVRVYTIGFGTAHGALYPDCPQKFLSSEPKGGDDNFMLFEGDAQHGVGNEFQDQYFSGRPYEGSAGASGGGSGSYPRGIDEASLKQIAAMTGGAYYSAESASELQQVFKELSTHLITSHATYEISVAFAAVGMLFTALAVILSLLWQPL